MQIKIPSFKYKMVLFSFVLVGTCLGIFLYYIVDYFQSDKRAYLYEEAFRFGLEANSSLERSAAFGRLLSDSIEPSEINFKDLQHDVIAIKVEENKKSKPHPWVYNKTKLKELNLPENDFLGSFENKDVIQFLPTPELKSGYFRITHLSEKFRSIFAIYPEDFFELLNTRKFARVVIVDHSTKSPLFKSPGFPNDFDAAPFTHADAQPRSFDRQINNTNYFVTSHFSKMINASMIILYNMDEANATLAFLSNTLIWAAVGLFGFGLILSTFFANSLARPLETLADMARKVSRGDLNARVSFNNSDETGILAASFNHMMDEIQTFIEELKGKARLESELKLASLVQRNFFDLTPIDKPSFFLQGDYISASECAGDWWNIKEWDGKFLLLLGDATGHGAPSALLTSAVFSAIECIQAEITSKPLWWQTPSAILYKLNHVVISLSKDIMMTFVVGIYDPETNKLWLSNASHEAPVCYNLTNPPKSTSEIGFLFCDTGPRLGDNAHPIYTDQEFQLNPMDRLLFYTDGLLESLVEPGRKFSERFLLKRLIQISNAPVRDALKMLIQVPVDGHPNDDISFFVMDIKNLPQKNTSMMNQVAKEIQFVKDIKMNDFGFMVGNLTPPILNKFMSSIQQEWPGAIIANNQRSRSNNFEAYIESFGSIRSTVKDRLRFAIDELILNGESHGKSAGAVTIHLEREQEGFWVKCRDNGGTFKAESAQKLYLSIFDDVLTPNLEGLGAGIGLAMILKMSEHFQIYTAPNKQTVVCCFIPDKTAERIDSFTYIIDPKMN